MKTTKKKAADYHLRLKTSATPAAAMRKINRVPAWWTTDFTGSAQKLNDVFTVRFGEIWKTFQVVEFVPGEKIAWRVVDCYMPWLKNKTEWKGTTVVWKFSVEKGFTRIDFTHVGLTPEVECYDDCNKGWNFFLKKSLLKLLTENKGDPHGK